MLMDNRLRIVPFLSGNFRMVGPHHSGLPYTDLGVSSNSSSSNDEYMTIDSSSDDDSELQDVPARHLAHLVIVIISAYIA